MHAWRKSIFGFPNSVNEYAARIVATMVSALGLTIVIFDISWLLIPLLYGFTARVLTGPTLSPFGTLATRLIIPMLGNPEKSVAGRPKQFAQVVGMAFSTASLLLYFVAGSQFAAYAVLSILILFAVLEAVLGFCAGCFVFRHLMVWGFVPQRFCQDCETLEFKQN